MRELSGSHHCAPCQAVACEMCISAVSAADQGAWHRHQMPRSQVILLELIQPSRWTTGRASARKRPPLPVRLHTHRAYCSQVILPEPPQWEVEHQTWMAELREGKQKHYPPEFIDPKRSGGAGAGSAGAVSRTRKILQSPFNSSNFG